MPNPSTFLAQRRPWLLLLVVLAVAYYASYVRYGINFRDEGGTVALNAQRLLAGEIPFRDIELGYNVLWFYPVVGLFKLFGTNFVLLRGYCFFLSTITAVLAFLTVERASRRPWFAFLVALMIVAVPGSTFKNYMPLLAVANCFCLLHFALGRRLRPEVAAVVVPVLEVDPAEGVVVDTAAAPVAAVAVEPASRGASWLWLAAGAVVLGLTFLIRIDVGTFFLLIWLGGEWLLALRPRISAGQRLALFLAGPITTVVLATAVHIPVYLDAQERGFDRSFILKYLEWPRTLVNSLHDRVGFIPAIPVAPVEKKEPGVSMVQPAPAEMPVAQPAPAPKAPTEMPAAPATPPPVEPTPPVPSTPPTTQPSEGGTPKIPLPDASVPVPAPIPPPAAPDPAAPPAPATPPPCEVPAAAPEATTKQAATPAETPAAPATTVPKEPAPPVSVTPDSVPAPVPSQVPPATAEVTASAPPEDAAATAIKPAKEASWNTSGLRSKTLADLLTTKDRDEQILIILRYAPLVTLIPLALWAVLAALRGMRSGVPGTVERPAAALLVLGGALTLLPQYFFFRSDAPHLSEFSPGFWVGAFSAVLLLGWGERRRFFSPARLGGLLLLLLLLAHAGLYLYRMMPNRWTGTIAARSNRNTLFHGENGVDVYVSKKENEALSQLLALIRAHSGDEKKDYLVCYPYSPSVNVLSNRRTYEKNVYVDNATSGRGWNEAAIARIQQYQPNVIVLSDWAINGTEESRFSVWAEKTKTWVQTNYLYQGNYLEFEVFTRPEKEQ